jgi:hypothetical protein
MGAEGRLMAVGGGRGALPADLWVYLEAIDVVETDTDSLTRVAVEMRDDG